MTAIDLDALSPRERYKLLCAVVIPRPIAWVTTLSPAKTVNAAPFSFFNVFGADPALVILGLERRADGERKDTAVNIAAGGEFVVNIVTPSLAEAMVASAALYPSQTSEPEALGLATAPSLRVSVPRLAAVPVALECRHRLTLAFSPEREIVIGEALALNAKDGLVDVERMHVHWGDELPLARLYAERYARLEELPGLAIPELEVAP